LLPNQTNIDDAKEGTSAPNDLDSAVLIILMISVLDSDISCLLHRQGKVGPVKTTDNRRQKRSTMYRVT
jgi:hypothetical protein